MNKKFESFTNSINLQENTEALMERAKIHKEHFNLNAALFDVERAQRLNPNKPIKEVARLQLLLKKQTRDRQRINMRVTECLSFIASNFSSNIFAHCFIDGKVQLIWRPLSNSGHRQLCHPH